MSDLPIKDVPEDILHAALTVSLRSDLLSSYISRIVDAILWDRTPAAVNTAYEDLKVWFENRIYRAYVEGKASVAPEEATKLFEKVLDKLASDIRGTQQSLQNISNREDLPKKNE